MSVFSSNLSFFIFALVCFSQGYSVFTSSFTSDSHALFALKRGFNAQQSSLTSWNSSSCVCLWSGVECRGDRVTGLDLSGLSLGGSVSPSLSSLDKVTHLSLAGNNFTGSIDFLGSFPNLRSLNLSTNQFNGSVFCLSYFQNLENLDLFNNNFNSTLPLNLTKNLRHLNFGGSYFYGAIPAEYGELGRLEYLFLAGNKLVGKIPYELGNLANLNTLYLGYNLYQGGIPKEFGKLVNLVALALPDCGLEGSIPEELGSLTLLETFYLHDNHLSGTIPNAIGNLNNLVNLDFSNNTLIGQIPNNFVSLKKLKVLHLFNNRLDGPIDFVGSLPRVETLQLWNNSFTGFIPRNLGRNGKLQNLDLSSNNLTGTLPPDLCKLGELRILILFNNVLLGRIPKGFGSCYNLTQVKLSHNYLSGSFPNGLINLPKLSYLDLTKNLISGPLPIWTSNMRLLQVLMLGGNQLSGPIPSSIGQLQQVKKLDLSNNNLSGIIPPEVGYCTQLLYLDLSRNSLYGSIPPELFGIQVLSELNVSRNHLNGTLPLSMGSLKSLSEADLSFNNLSGQVPASNQIWFFTRSYFVGNPLLCGSVLNTPCNVTHVPASAHKSKWEYKLILAVGLLVCCSVVLSGVAVFKANFKAKSLEKSEDSWEMTKFQKVSFTVSDILECMVEGNVIGRGGAGIVYHGTMPDGSDIAVKKLPGLGTNRRGYGFRAEIETLGNIRHRNIVRLLAFCSSEQANLLVYEYMPNGSLKEALHGNKLESWNLRYKIATEVAKGLSYLHHDCRPLIIHRDVKSNNVLLNSDFEAFVADFGLAKYLNGGGAPASMSNIAGTHGYIAPEYAHTLRVDEKSDVYSYGVVLLELITGRHAIDDFGECIEIVEWSRHQTSSSKENVHLIIDSQLAADVSIGQASHLFFIAMLCTQENSRQRPTMRRVVVLLAEYEASSSRT